MIPWMPKRCQKNSLPAKVGRNKRSAVTAYQNTHNGFAGVSKVLWP